MTFDHDESATPPAADDAAMLSADLSSRIRSPAISTAADDVAIRAADQDPLPLPGIGHLLRRADGHASRREPGSGLSGHAAFDYGTDLWVSVDGDAAESFRLRRRTPKRPFCHDVVECIRILFDYGYDIVTEAPTMASFGMRGRITELLNMLGRFPDRTLYTVGSQGVQNELRRQNVAYDSSTDHGLAAATIWTLAARHPPKRWRPSNPDDRIYRVDPVRPYMGGLVQMRNDGYPDDRWRREVLPYLPNAAAVDDDQRRILHNRVGIRSDWARDRCSALIWSLREPSSWNRYGWERVIGASSHGRPSIYRQMLVVGKPRADYEHGQHFTGLSFRAAMRAMRRLRTMILASHPELHDPEGGGRPGVVGQAR